MGPMPPSRGASAAHSLTRVTPKFEILNSTHSSHTIVLMSSTLIYSESSDFKVYIVYIHNVHSGTLYLLTLQLVDSEAQAIHIHTKKY